MRAVLVTLAALAVTGRGAADLPPSPASSPTAFSWFRGSGAEACPAVHEVAPLIARQLQRDPFVSPAQARQSIDAMVERLPDMTGFRVHIVITGASASPGARELSVATAECEEAAETAALAIALMMAPDGHLGGAEAQAMGERVTPAPETLRPPIHAEPEEPEPRPVVQPPPAPRHWRARIALAATGAVGQLPDASAGAAALFALGPPARSVGLELGLAYLPEQRVAVTSVAGATFSATTAALAGWWTPFQGEQLRLSLVAGAEVGRMTAGAFGFALRNEQAKTWLLNASALTEASYAVAPSWEPMLRLGLAVPLRRDTFEANGPDGADVIFRPKALIVVAAAGIAFSP